jgi:dTDP-4-dehydrorhamnose 3,5-epimerase
VLVTGAGGYIETTLVPALLEGEHQVRASKWESVLLSAKEQNQIYVPIGFAHGFLTPTDTVQFLYKCSEFYDPADEHGIAWNDPGLKICWGVTAPTISARDAEYPALAQVPRALLPKHPEK